MATATLEFDAPPGLTLTIELYDRGANGTNIYSVGATERTSDLGSYVASIVDIASGTYRLRIRNAANQTIARDLLVHTNAAGVENPAGAANVSGGGANIVTETTVIEIE